MLWGSAVYYERNICYDLDLLSWKKSMWKFDSAARLAIAERA
jgi:hypothetical protein